MITPAVPDITLRITPLKGQPEATTESENLRSFFWSQVRLHPAQTKPPEYADADFERLIQANLGNALRLSLMNYFHEILGRGGFHQSQPVHGKHDEIISSLSGIAFSAKILGYSSLLTGITVSGLNDLAKLFGGALDAFSAFLNAYIPHVMTAALPGYSLPVTDFDYEIEFSNSITTSFHGKQPSPVSLPQGTAKSDSSSNPLNRFWLISNLSLLIPVLLSLVIFYFVYSGIVEEKKSMADLVKTIQESQNALLSSFQDRMKAYDSFELEVIRTSIRNPSEKASTIK